jgi:hypothetical protein
MIPLLQACVMFGMSAQAPDKLTPINILLTFHRRGRALKFLVLMWNVLVLALPKLYCPRTQPFCLASFNVRKKIDAVLDG